MGFWQSFFSNRYLLIFLGGAVGSVLRYGLGSLIQSGLGSGFPWSTLTVNLLGSFLIGLVLRLSAEGAVSQEGRFLLAMGFCGGFTTFSTLSWEALGLLQGRQWVSWMLYTQLSLLLGLLLAWLGYSLGGRMVA